MYMPRTVAVNNVMVKDDGQHEGQLKIARAQRVVQNVSAGRLENNIERDSQAINDWNAFLQPQTETQAALDKNCRYLRKSPFNRRYELVVDSFLKD